MKPFWMILLLFVAMLGSGCARLRTERDYATPRVLSPVRPSNLGYYIPNRIADVLDVVDFGVMFGLGLNIRFQATNLVQVALPTTSAGPEIGWNTDWKNPIKADESNYFWRRYKPFTVGAHGGKALPVPLVNINVGEIKRSPDDINLGVHLLVVGANVGVRPVEILDLVSGIVFIDFNHDDLWVKPSKKKSASDEAEEELEEDH
ncbi:hypothetical protein GC173_04215 [bacterium]|nr:hypothetical protein [bacterium]